MVNDVEGQEDRIAGRELSGYKLLAGFSGFRLPGSVTQEVISYEERHDGERTRLYYERRATDSRLIQRVGKLHALSK